MQKKARDARSTRTAETGLAILTPSRITALAFVLSIALPIGWGLADDKPPSPEPEVAVARAPETTEDLLALAAVNVPARLPQPRVVRALAERPVETSRQGSRPEVQAFDSTPTVSEVYSRNPHGLRMSDVEESAQADTEDAAPVSVPQQDESGLTLIAGAAGAESRSSTSALLSRSAAAPQLSAVGAATSRTARDAADQPSSRAGSSGAVLRSTAASPRPAGPVAATRKEIEAARAARAQALSGSGGQQTTRRRTAMHRMAAAAASSLNETTPFRTAGSGAARFAGGVAGGSLGAGLDRAAEAISVVPGLRLENVSLSAGYSSNGLPGARSIYGRESGLGSDTDFGAQATLAFRKRFRTSSFGLTYTPSRNQRSRYSDWNTTDHVLGIEFDRQLGRRWGLALNASGSNTGLEQFWFRRPITTRVENPPASLEELLQRVEAGEFTDDEFASLITGAPVIIDPGGRELELTRVTSLNATSTATYAHSARLHFTMGVGASRYDSSFRNFVGDASDRLSVNNIQRQFAFVESAYRFSRDVTTGFRYNASMNDSSFGRSQAHSSTGFVRKKLGRFWTAELEGGAGYVNFDSDNGFLATLRPDALQSRPTWVAGGALQYRYGGHSFDGFAKRQVGDSLGLSSSSTLSTGLNWEWTTPRMPWIFFGSGSHSKSDYGFVVADGSGTAYQSSLLQAGLTRRLSSTTAFTTGYYFGRYSSPFRGLLTGATVHRVQASFLWRPVEAR